MRARLIALSALLVFICGAGNTIAAPTTTRPKIYVDIRVTLTDTKIILSRHSAPRGTNADFIIHNAGKSLHSFTVGAHGAQPRFTRVVRPSETNHLLLFLDYRGRLDYSSKLPADQGKLGMKGSFLIK